MEVVAVPPENCLDPATNGVPVYVITRRGSKQYAAPRAFRRVFRAADSSDEYTGMGSTIVAALVQDNRLVYSGVGDSRLYFWHAGELSQLTEDDSWIATVLACEEDGDEVELASHPMRNVLTNVLGATEETEVAVKEQLVRDGETLLLCSDGVHETLDDAALGAMLSDGADVAALTQRIVDVALDAKASDNVTALGIRYEE